MTRLRHGFLLAVIGVLLTASNANASRFTSNGEPVRSLNVAYRIAIDYWGVGRPPGCTSIDKQVAEDLLSQSGRATIPPNGEPVPCVIEVAPDLVPSKIFIVACTVMVHEVGHLLGLGHSEDPANIMYPTATIPPPTCWRRFRKGV